MTGGIAVAAGPGDGRHAAPTTSSHGMIRSQLAQPDGQPLWCVTSALATGAEIQWGPDHCDEVVYVASGAVDVDGVECGPRTAIAPEAGAPVQLSALVDAEILHFGSLAGAAGKSRTVHVVGPGARFAGTSNRDGRHLFTESYFDSTCPSCELTLLQVWSDGPYKGASHSHSADELIRVVHGEIVVGAQRVPAGAVVAVPAGRRYRFSAPGAFSFLNYRPRAATITHDPHAPGRHENAAALGWQPTDSRFVDIYTPEEMI